jgi:hypothetical protein
MTRDRHRGQRDNDSAFASEENGSRRGNRNGDRRPRQL